MSWQDRIKENIIITTGDKKQWDVLLWVNPSKSTEWSSSEYNFINVQGKRVERGKLAGRTYPLEFYFQGDDHLTTFSEFEKSANAPGEWLIVHPYYGNIVATITSLSVDNSQQNISKVSCTALETITKDFPETTFNAVDFVILKKDQLDFTLEQQLKDPPTVTDENIIKLTNDQNYKEGIKIISVDLDAEEYFNAFNEAQSAVSVITAAPIQAMRATISLLTLPSKFVSSVQDRINTLITTFKNLRSTLINLVNPASKQIYEIQGAAIISSMFYASATPLDGNYTSSRGVIKILESLTSNYKQYRTDLDSIQGVNGSSPDYYIPSYEAQSQLAELYNTTVSNLILIALNGKREYSVVLTEDSNLINLTHKFYGNKNFDADIDTFVNQNNFKSIDDYLGLKKGRTVVYFK